MKKNAPGGIPGFILILISLFFMSSCNSPILLSDGTERYPPGHYLNWLETATPAELERKRERIAHYEDPASPVVIVQMALLLSASQAANNDNERIALNLIETLDPGTAGSNLEQEYLAFAGIWKQLLEQRLTLREAQQRNDTLEQETEDINAQNRRLQAQTSALQTQINTLQEQISTLQEQINTLTTIERQLIEREQTQE